MTSPTPQGSDSPDIERQAELLRSALSLAMWHAQDLRWVSECDALLRVVRRVDRRRLDRMNEVSARSERCGHD